MFGNKKSFNEGMKNGIRLSEEIVKKDTKAVNKIYEMLEKMPEDMRELKESFEEVIKSLEKTDIEKLFGIVRTSSPNDLEEEEKIILLQILVDISRKYGSNSDQKNFLKNLIHYFGINFESSLKENDFKNAIDNIDSKKAEKMMYKIIKEYLYLENNTNNYGNKYDEYLSLFACGVKDNGSIENEIELKVNIFGEEILYQQFSKYSYDLKDIRENEFNDKKINVKDYYIEMKVKEKEEITKQIFEFYLQDYDSNCARNKLYEIISYDIYVETSNYVVYSKNERLVSLNKKTKEKKEIILNFEISKEYMSNELFKNKCITSYNDILYIIAENNEIYFYNIDKNICGKIETPKSECKKFNIKVEKNILCYLDNYSNIFLMDIEKHYKHFEIIEKNDTSINMGFIDVNFNQLNPQLCACACGNGNIFNNFILEKKEYYIKYKKENYTCKSVEKTDFFIIKDKDIYFLSADDKTWKLKRFNVETEFEENYSLEFERKDWLNNEYKVLKMGEYLDNIYLIFSVANRIDIVNIDFKEKKVKNSFLGMKQNIFLNRKQVEVYDNFLVMRDVKSEKVYVYVTNLVKDKLVVTKNKKDYIKLGQFLTTEKKNKIFNLKDLK
jgi:hypothetical protein